MIYWLNGTWSEEANNLLLHSLHYGTTIFEGIRFYKTEKGSAIFRLKCHIERFFHSAKSIGVALPYKLEDLCSAVISTVEKSGIEEGYIRPIGFFGDKDMELYPKKAFFHVAIFVWPWEPRLGINPLKLKVSPFIRTPPEATKITAKLSGHYANSFLARYDAVKDGYSEALLLDGNQRITEGAGANFFGVQEDCLVTPPKGKIFPGLTRDTVIFLAKKLGIPVLEKALLPSDKFDEAFLTGTAVEIVPVSSIDKNEMGMSCGPFTLQLKQKYTELVHGMSDEKWLSYASMCNC